MSESTTMTDLADVQQGSASQQTTAPTESSEETTTPTESEQESASDSTASPTDAQQGSASEPTASPTDVQQGSASDAPTPTGVESQESEKPELEDILSEFHRKHMETMERIRHLYQRRHETQTNMRSQLQRLLHLLSEAKQVAETVQK